MKILHNTDAFIKGKLYKEGSPIPKEYEKEFEQYLVETEIKYPDVDETIKSVDTKPAQVQNKDSDNQIKKIKRSK
jgi:hypothetical protein